MSLSCPVGSSLDGSSTATCHVGGLYDVTSACQPDCTGLSIASATLSTGPTVAFGASVTVTCAAGFDLQGVADVRDLSPKCRTDQSSSQTASSASLPL